MDCGSFCRTCSAQRESVYVDFFSRCWLFWQCPIAISIAFSSDNMEPTLLVILACLATNPSMHTVYWIFTVAPVLWDKESLTKTYQFLVEQNTSKLESIFLWPGLFWLILHHLLITHYNWYLPKLLSHLTHWGPAKLCFPWYHTKDSNTFKKKYVYMSFIVYLNHISRPALTGKNLQNSIHRQQGKSQGFDSCNWPSNFTQLDSNCRLFGLCDLEISWMTLKYNRAILLYYVKLCASFQSHYLIQFGITVQKRPIRVKIGNFCLVIVKIDEWPWKTKAHLLCYSNHFTSFRSHQWIQSGVLVRKCPILGQNWLFFAPCDHEIW